MSNTRSSFTGKIGFVLAAAGSAVGLGNIWRFPYLAAKYGGGILPVGVLCGVDLVHLVDGNGLVTVAGQNGMESSEVLPDRVRCQ